MSTPWRGVREEAFLAMAPLRECGRQAHAPVCPECAAWIEGVIRRAMAAGVALADDCAEQALIEQVARGDHDEWREDES